MTDKTLRPDSLLAAKELQAFADWMMDWRPTTGASNRRKSTLVDKLVIRDRKGDDRRLCLECAHLHGAGRWRCGKWRAADVPVQGLARDLVLILQRCNGFRPANAAP